ncbi:hypothetical protein HOY82DRAFT_603149 [Tuber indicum]|nr:hypothetical protein HOY82DRAFT_603149 [Tuber indicum]
MRTISSLGVLVPNFILRQAQKAFGVTPPNPTPVTTTAEEEEEESRTSLDAGIPMPRPVLIYDSYSNSDFVGTLSIAFPYGRNGITGGDSRVPQMGESLGPRIPEPAIIWGFL